MAIRITPEEMTARARADLRMGVPVCLTDDSGAMWLAAATETLTSARLGELRAMSPELDLALTHWRAQTLLAPAYDGDLVRIAVPDAASVGWAHAMADPSLDLDTPLKGPFSYVRTGNAAAHRAAIGLCKSAGLLPAAVLIPVSTRPKGVTPLPVAEPDHPTPMDLISSARVPLEVSRNARVAVYRRRDGGEEHYVIEVGNPDPAQPVLSRLHSACFTGDLIGSLKCDCGAQLRAALHQIGEEGAGVLLYLNQEGRGIGLANKMRAYALQDQGFDTVEANHRLGFEDDERDFRLGAELLRRRGYHAVRLMTNNPAKIARMEEAGIRVAERVPLRVGRTAENTDYLDTKAAKSGHLL
ncbi:MAG: GTP cyclohydrolase II [Pseudomonadota bacterium]